MDREASCAAVHGVAESQTGLSVLNWKFLITPAPHLEKNHGGPTAWQDEALARASAKTRGCHTQLDEGSETP